MTLDELAIRAALNVLRDSVESGRMPSGEALDAVAVQLHTQAIDSLDRMLAIIQFKIPPLERPPLPLRGPQ